MTNPIKLRHKARILMMQALYRTHFLEQDTASLIAHSVEGVDLNKIDYPYFQESMNQLIENVSEIDNKLIPYLDRPLDQLNPVELAVLRVAVFELLYRLEIPYKVVINEAIEITKKYGSVQGYKFVNGVLDKMSSNLRKNG